MSRTLPRADVGSADINETASRARANAPEFARQARQNRSKTADGGIHAVKRAVAKSRVQEAAAATEVALPPAKRWMKASALPSIPAPPGYYLEWVRRDNSVRGDCENLVAHLSEGWEIARKSDFPGKFLPTQRVSDHGECIGNASSILMKLPLAMKQERDAYYRNQRDRATKSVGMADPAPEGVSHHSMPIVEDTNQVRVAMRAGKARRAPVRVADDA
jgi:hypothetical protein